LTQYTKEEKELKGTFMNTMTPVYYRKTKLMKVQHFLQTSALIIAKHRGRLASCAAMEAPWQKTVVSW